MLGLISLLSAFAVAATARQDGGPLPDERPGPDAAAALTWAMEARQPCNGDAVCLGARASLLNSSMAILMGTPCPQTPATCSTDETAALAAARSSFGALRVEIGALGVPLSADSLRESSLDESAASGVVQGWIRAAEGDCSHTVRICYLGRLWLLSEADQAARTLPSCPPDHSVGGPCWTDKRETIRAIDRQLSPAKHRLLDEAGWPSSDIWGSSASTAAWLLVQHSDAEPDFQRAVLSKLTDADTLPPDERRHTAYLMDRVAIAAGKAQWFGTQGTCREGTWEALPVQDADRLEERRGRLSLGSMAEYARTAGAICSN